MAVEKQKYRRKALRKRKKGFQKKAVEAEGQTYEPGAFWSRFLWVTCVFLKLKVCAFWRSAAHSVHDDFLTIHCGPMKVYIFDICEVIASAWIKWFSRKLSFSTTYPSQKKSAQIKCFVSARGGGVLVISVTISQAVLNLRHSCTSPVLCWSLESISIAIAWEKKVLGCHKFCLSMSSISWLSTGLNHIFLAKTVFPSKADVPMNTLWKNESIPTRIVWAMAKRVPRLLRAIPPPPPPPPNLKKAIFERFQIFNQLPVQNLKFWDKYSCGMARGSSWSKQNSYF